MMRRLNFFINRVLHLFEVRRINNDNKDVFLTFDDGPEPNITEFILDELRKYNYKATFFCRGDNAEANKVLLDRILEDGHRVGNHTYKHINSFKTNTKEYLEDVKHAATVLHTNLFRPPWGSITLIAFLKLCRKYKIIYWSLTSGDTNLENFDKKKSLDRLKTQTQAGDVVLFHCCQRHQKETMQLLPDYLKWLNSEGFGCKVIK